MPIAYQLEAWNRTNTARRAVFVSLQSAAGTWSLGAYDRGQAGDERRTFVVATADAATAQLTKGAVLRLQRQGVATEFDLYRLGTRGSRENGRLTELAGDALWMTELAQGRISQGQADGRTTLVFGLIALSPTAWLTDVIIPACASDALTFAVGVVEPTAPVDLSFDNHSPLAAARMLEAATLCELQFRYSTDGHTCYVDLLARIGQAAGGAELRAGKNVAAIELVEDQRAPATRLYARGAGMLTLADATWTAQSAAGAAGARVLTFAAGITNPVFEDGAFVGLWFYSGATAYPITASSASARTITVNATALPALNAGAVGYLASSAGGTRLTWLESPAGRAEYGIRYGDDVVAEDIPDAVNLVPNGDLTGAYSGGLPPGWSAIGAPTCAESTNLQYARVGGQACHVSATVDGDGIRSPTATVVTDTFRPYMGMRVGVTVISRKVRALIRHSNGTTYPVQLQSGSAGLGVPLELRVGPVHEQPLPAGTFTIDVVAHGGAADYYVDFAMATPEVASDVPAYVAGQGAQVLWDRTARRLADERLPRREYRVDVVNLYQIDPTRFQFDRIGRGDTVKVRYDGFPAESLRVVELADDPVTGRVLSLALSTSARTRPPNEASPYVPDLGAMRPRPAVSPPAPVRAGLVGYNAQFDATDGKVYLSAQGNALAASLQLYTKTTRAAAWPGSPTETLASRSGTFTGISVGAALFYRIVSLDGAGAAGDTTEDVYSRADGPPPTVEPRRGFNGDRTAADVYVKLESRGAERIRLAVKDSEGSGAPIWRQCVASGNATAVWNTSGTEVDGSAAWFTDGAGSYAQKLKAIPLVREAIVRVYLQAEGESTALKSTWVALALESKQVPLLESVDLTWRESDDKLVATAAGGAFCQSVRFDMDDDPNFGSPVTVIEGAYQSLADGGKVTVTASLSAGDRGKLWYLRVTPYNGPLSGGLPTGFQNTAASRDTVAVPASEVGGGVQQPTASIDLVSSTTADETVSYTGTAGAGASSGVVSMRRRKYTSVSAAGTWTSPASSMANETVSRSPKWITYLELEVTDADGRITTSEPYPIAASTPGVDGTTGGIVPGQIIPGTVPAGVNAPGGTPLTTVESGGVRAYNTILANYQLAPATVIEALPVSRGVKKGSAVNTNAIVFGSPAFPSTPHVLFGVGGLTYYAPWSATSHGPVCEALNLSASGFTMRAVLRQAVGTLTGRSASFSGDTATKGFATEAWNDTYRFAFSVTVGAGVPDPFDVTAPRSPSSVTLYFYSNDGSTGDVQRSSRVFSNDTAGGVTFSSQVEDIVVDAMGNGDTFRIVIADTEGNGGSVTRTSVTWDEATAPGEQSMGVTAVPFTAMMGT